MSPTDPVARRVAAVRAALGEGDPDPDRVYHLPPADLVFAPNVRAAYPPDPEFEESLRQDGVLQPVTCYLEDGELYVTIGGRRTRCAIEAGLPTVPLIVRAKPQEIDRIAVQVGENDRRAALSAGDRAAAAQQLALCGLPADAISRRLSMPRTVVDTALTVAASPAACAAAAEYELDMEQAAAVAELADDPQVVQQLLAAAADPDRGRGEFRRVVEQARDERRDQAERDQAVARVRARGMTVVEDRPSWAPSDLGPRYLSLLHIADSDHLECPGHAVWLSERWDGGADGGRGAKRWVEVAVCTDAATHHPAQPVQTDLEAAARAQERADVIRVNKEWRAAEQVRRRWLRELAQRKTAPAGTERFVLSCLLHCDHSTRAFEWGSNHQLLRDLLGLDREPREDEARRLSGPRLASEVDIAEILAQVAAAPAKRVHVLLLVLVLAAWEERTSVQTWRTPTEQDRRYMRQLIEWGYEPSLVERRILTEAQSPADTSW